MNGIETVAMLARICLVVLFPFSALDKIVHWSDAKKQAESSFIPGGASLVIAALVVEIVTPICIVFGWYPRIAALVLAACGDKKADAPAADAAPAMAPAAAAPAATVAMAPITGKTWEVKMIGDGTTYKYDPADLTIAPGDGVKFVMISTGPHNVAFDPAQPAFAANPTAKAQLMANMTEQVSELSGKFLNTPNEEYVISFAGVPAGTYEYFCTPHIAMNMRGKITVK